MKGLSIVVVSMNRTEHLLQSVPTWKNALKNVKEPSEILILDWGSYKPIENLWDIRLIRLERKKWHLSLAYNYAIQLSMYNTILKLDADSLLSADFFVVNVLEDHTFLTGDWSTARDENERHTNGVAFFSKDLFYRIHGYNERIVTYGYDDSDFYERASKYARHLYINQDTLKHIPHVDRGCLDLRLSTFRNMMLSHKNLWKGPMTHISCLQLDKLIKPRKIYIEAVNGLCNRLRSFISAAVVACSLNRDLVLVWIPSFHCEAKFDDLFDVAYMSSRLPINFTLSLTRPQGLSIYTEINVAVPSMPNLPSLAGMPSMPNLPSLAGIPSMPNLPSLAGMPSIPLSVGMQNLSSLDVMQNLSSLDVIERPLSEDEDIYIISSNVLSNKHTNWLKESELLKKVLKPVPIIETEIKKYGSMRNHVGIHIRMGQQNSLHDSTEGWVEPCKKSWKKWRENSHVSIFIRKVEEILHKTPNQKFFLAADTKHSYDMFLNRFENIRYVPRKLFDRSAEQVKYALIDIFLLSQTDYLLGSNWSTFTEIAQKLGGKKCFFAGIDFL